MNKYYDYCDAYDAYDAYGSESLDKSNKIKTFSCSVCKQSKLVLKKSIDDPVFKCEECIKVCLNASNDNQVQHQQQETTWRWFSFF